MCTGAMQTPDEALTALVDAHRAAGVTDAALADAILAQAITLYIDDDLDRAGLTARVCAAVTRLVAVPPEST